MRYWGITGTNGKTTCTWITAAFIDAQPSRRCGYVTTVEVWTGSRRFSTGYTTPPYAQLREIFAEMEANGCTDCVMEVSSHAIHQHRTGDTVFAGGAFTNLTEDHLDYHKTMAAYFDVKLDFARQIAAAHPVRPDMGRRELPPYVVCLDGGCGREMYEAVGNLPVDVIPVRAGADGANRPAYDLDGLQLVGAYNRSNVLVAAALAEAAGVSHETIQAVIPTLRPRWGRLEYVPCASRAKVYVDFAHTPDGLEKVLSAVRDEMRPPASANPPSEQSAHSLWVVFGAGGDRDPMKRPLMGAACARLADRLVVTSDNPRSEDPMKIIEAIVAGVRQVRAIEQSPIEQSSTPQSSVPQSAIPQLSIRQSSIPRSNNLVVEPDRAKAIAYALAEAAAGDVVVIAGKGHETTQEIKGVKHPFDDREVVRAWQRSAGE